MTTITGGRENVNSTHFCEVYERLSVSASVLNADEIHFRLQNVMLPIILVTLFTTFFQLLLRPFGQVMFVAQMLAGIIFGPMIIGNNEKLSKQIFSPKVTAVLNLFEMFGMSYMVFLLSVRMDISIIKKSGRLAFIIGIGAFFIPTVATIIIAYFVRDGLQLDEELRKSLPVVASLESTVSFPVIFTILNDLKILNSELGRLTLSSALINGLVGLFVIVIAGHAQFDIEGHLKHVTLLKYLSLLCMLVVITFAFRPMMLWMMRQTPEGKSLKHVHLLAINLMFLGCVLFGEFTGLRSFIGPAVLGMATPVSPPMGPLLAEKSQLLMEAVFVPCLVVNTGRDMDLFSIKLHDFYAVELMVWVAALTKFIAIIGPSLYYKMPLMDALSLTVILNGRGIYDVNLFRFYLREQLITKDSFTIMVLTSAFQSAIYIPTVRYIYDSSRRYVAYRRRTLQHNGNQTELRILACMSEPDDVPTIINILNVSNPPRSQIGVYIMKLEEYIGRNMPVVIQHRFDQTPHSSSTKVNPMINAFRHYQDQNKGNIMVQCFTAIAPYATMHDDICLMAFEKSTTLVIIPFQKSNFSLTHIVIKNFLKTAPCSVAMFYDRGLFMDPKPLFSRQQMLTVCVIFIGGSDDREALAYGTRMAEHQNIMLKVLRFVDMHHTNNDFTEEKHDLEMINDLRSSSSFNKNIEYLEEIVSEGSHTTWILNSIGNDFDLILVGRRHENQSNILLGLEEWSEIEVLGVVGDILVSSDYRGTASVMVIQQQASVVEGMIESSPKYIFK